MVPDGAAQRIRHQRRDHAAMQRVRAVRVARPRRHGRRRHLGEAEILLHLIVPRARQRDSRLVRRADGFHAHLRGRTEHAGSIHVAEDAHGQRVAARGHQRAGHGVIARRAPGQRIVVDIHAAHRGVVPVGDVRLVNGREMQRQVAARPGGGDIEFQAEPDHAVVLQSAILPVTWQFHLRPVTGIRRRVRPSLPEAQVPPVLGQRALLPLGVGFLIRGLHVVHAAHHRLILVGEMAQRGIGFQRLTAGPRLRHRATPGGVDDADGDAESPAQLTREEITHGGEIAGVIGIARPPGARDVLYGMIHRIFRHREHA
ncbi:MAG: hypothetical protein BWY76_01074 [bacterium ADurb.Bin429]|nr:MAG: hypothetical protein BWY76_01074 [bacterium ADurb.Bin429]